MRNCVNALGFSAVRCSINQAVLFERLWPAGLTAINVIVQEPCPVSDNVGLFEGDHSRQPFMESHGAYQLPSECVNLFDKMTADIDYIKTRAIAQTPPTSYEVRIPYAVLDPQTKTFSAGTSPHPAQRGVSIGKRVCGASPVPFPSSSSRMAARAQKSLCFRRFVYCSSGARLTNREQNGG